MAADKIRPAKILTYPVINLQSLLARPRVPTETISRWYVSPVLAWLIIGFGALVRVAGYLHNPSLWVDEAALATSIAANPISGLTGYLETHTAAPIGFLIVEKWSVGLLGNNEYALRLFPMLLGVGAVYLMYVVAKRYLSPWAVPIALVLFATSTSLVRFSNQVKQYSGDAFFTLVLLLFTSIVIEKGYQPKWLVIFAIVGAVAIWFSYPVVFIMAGVGIVLGWQAFQQRQWVNLTGLGFVGAVWIISFLAFYYVSSLGQIVLQEQGVIDFLSERSLMVPLIPRSLADVLWFLDTPFDLFDVPAGIALTGTGMMCFGIGLLAFWKANKLRFSLLLAPLAVTVLVSGAQLYPFADRWVLFLVPVVLLLVGEGGAFIFSHTRNVSYAIGVLLISLLVLHPISSEVFRLIEPRGTEAVRPVVEYMDARRLDGDKIYVYSGAFKAFSYYADRFGIDETEYVIGGRDVFEVIGFRDLNVYVDEINQMRGNDRVWFIFSNVSNTRYTGGQINEEAFHVFYLDNIGERLDQFRIHRATVYLYDLSAADTLGDVYLEPKPPDFQP